MSKVGWVWVWPTATLGFVVVIAAISASSARETGHSFADAAQALAMKLSGLDEQQAVEMGWGFAFLSVMAAIVIGMAFSLPPEGTQALPRDSREMIAFVTAGVILVVSMFSAVVLWVVVWQQATFELVVMLLAAWLITVVASLVNLKRPVEERVVEAKERFDKLHAAMNDAGLHPKTDTTGRGSRGAEVAFWMIPIGALFVLGGACLVADFSGPDVPPLARVLLGTLVMSAAVVACGWRAGMPLLSLYPADRVMSWAIRGLGLMLMAAPVAIAWFAELWAFFVLSVLGLAVTTVLYCVPPITNRISFMKTIRDTELKKRFEQAEDRYSTALEEQKAAEPSQPQEPTVREPLIRFELYGRRRR